MIKVLIVDDQELFRVSLKVVLSVSENIRVTDAVSGVSQALKSAEQERPDVVLMDIRMPGMDGVEGTRLFKKRWPDVKIIVLADKLSNLRCTARDYFLLGDQIWERFNEKRKELHAWYYDGVAAELKELSSYPEYKEYVRLCRLVFHSQGIFPE